MKATPIVVILATILLTVPVALVHSADAPPKPPELKVLEQFVGTWDSETTAKPAEWTPQGGKTTGMNKIEAVLDGRFVQDTGLNADSSEHLVLWTYDTQAKAYRGWFFSSGGNVMELKGRWDTDAKELRMEADLGNGIISNGIHRFPDKDNYEWTVVAKDKAGKVFLDMTGKHRRRKAPLDKPKEKKEAGPPRPPELKVLDRLRGSWDTTAVSKPAVWTPKEVRTTSKVERKWVLGGRFLEDTSKAVDGTQVSSVAMMTYDSNMKAYRGWWFSSEGHANNWSGQWDEKTQTISFKIATDGGLDSRSSVRFIDKDRHEWKVVTKDGDGKVYFDTTWTVTRRKE